MRTKIKLPINCVKWKNATSSFSQNKFPCEFGSGSNLSINRSESNFYAVLDIVSTIWLAWLSQIQCKQSVQLKYFCNAAKAWYDNLARKLQLNSRSFQGNLHLQRRSMFEGKANSHVSVYFGIITSLYFFEDL